MRISGSVSQNFHFKLALQDIRTQIFKENLVKAFGSKQHGIDMLLRILMVLKKMLVLPQVAFDLSKQGVSIICVAPMFGRFNV